MNNIEIEVVKDLKFIEIKRDNHYEYHLPTTYEGFFSQTVHYRSVKEIDGIDDYDAINSYLRDKGITLDASEDDSLLFGKIIDELNPYDDIQMVFFNSPNAINNIRAASDVERLIWSHCLEYFVTDPILARDFGFLTPKEFLEAVNYSNKNLDNRYFHISNIDAKSVYQFKLLYGSDVTNWCFFITAHKDEIRHILQQNERPTLDQVLETVDYIIDLQIGEDEGYLDYVKVISKNRITTQIKKLEVTLNEFVTKYDFMLNKMELIDSLDKFEQYKKTIEEFMCL